MDWFTKLGFDAARTVHFYEADLATLAIIVWHLYFVIFNPDVYPMNLAWLTGRMSEREMIEEHPLQLEAMKAAERAGTDTAAAADPSVPPRTIPGRIRRREPPAKRCAARALARKGRPFVPVAFQFPLKGPRSPSNEGGAPPYGKRPYPFPVRPPLALLYAGHLGAR